MFSGSTSARSWPPRKRARAALVLERGDLGELGLDRRSSLGFDRGLVHEGQVVVADLARVGVGRARGGRGLLNQLLGAPARLLGEDGEGAERSAVGRDLGCLQPGAVGVGEEVVPRGDGAVDPGKVDSGFSLGGGSGQAEDHGEDSGESAERGESEAASAAEAAGASDVGAGEESVGMERIIAAP